MRMRLPAVPVDRRARLQLAGGFTAVVVAVVLYTRYGIDGMLSRDEAVYAYGGQQFAHGVAPYASIFDPKTPGATLLCGLGASLARLLGTNDVHTIRAVFFTCAVLAVLAVYLLVVQLTSSAVGGVAAAVVFASFQGFAADALSGPDAKTPGVLCAVVSMWLIARRTWFLAGLAGCLAFLVWQPMVIYPVIAVVAAALVADRRRAALAAAGAVTPFVLVVGYFAAVGHLGMFFEAAFQFPVEGVRRIHETVGHRIGHIATVVHLFYAFSGVLFWIGLGLVLVTAIGAVVARRADRLGVLTEPLVLVVLVTLLAEAGYACYDFQSYPDLFPLLPYAAVGFGVATALLVGRFRFGPARRGCVAVVLAAAAVLTGLSATWFDDAWVHNDSLRLEYTTACAVTRVVLPGTVLYALGDPVPLVTAQRRNPDRYIYLDSGVDRWKVDRTPGGLAGWRAQIVHARPSVIVIQAWHGADRYALTRELLRAGFQPGFVGRWRVLMTPEARKLAATAGVAVTQVPTKRPLTPAGTYFPERACANS